MAHSVHSFQSIDESLEAMRYLADQAVNRPLIHDLVARDLRQWDKLTISERRVAFERAHRRVGAVCPWIRSKGRVVDAAHSLGLNS